MFFENNPESLNRFKTFVNFNQRNTSESRTAQEDDYLISVAAMNADDHNLDFFESIGLTEKDYVIVTRYGGFEWEADWLDWHAQTYCWHIGEAEKMRIEMEKFDLLSVQNLVDIGYLNYLDSINKGI